MPSGVYESLRMSTIAWTSSSFSADLPRGALCPLAQFCTERGPVPTALASSAWVIPELVTFSTTRMYVTDALFSARLVARTRFVDVRISLMARVLSHLLIMVRILLRVKLRVVFRPMVRYRHEGG